MYDDDYDFPTDESPAEKWRLSWPQRDRPTSVTSCDIGDMCLILRYEGEIEMYEVVTDNNAPGKKWANQRTYTEHDAVYLKLRAFMDMTAGINGAEDPGVIMTMTEWKVLLATLEEMPHEWRALRRTLEEESGMGSEVAGGPGEGDLVP